jgi:hypothetical protein
MTAPGRLAAALATWAAAELAQHNIQVEPATLLGMGLTLYAVLHPYLERFRK